MNKTEIKKYLLERNRELLRAVNWDVIPSAEQAEVILDVYAHCLSGAVLGSVTFQHIPAGERLEQMKADLHFDLFQRAQKLISRLAHDEGSKN